MEILLHIIIIIKELLITAAPFFTLQTRFALSKLFNMY